MSIGVPLNESLAWTPKSPICRVSHSLSAQEFRIGGRRKSVSTLRSETPYWLRSTLPSTDESRASVNSPPFHTEKSSWLTKSSAKPTSRPYFSLGLNTSGLAPSARQPARPIEPSVSWVTFFSAVIDAIRPNTSPCFSWN